MTVILGLVQFGLIAYILVDEFKYKTAATFLWATLFLMFGIMHLLASFAGEYEYSQSVLEEASVFVILFCLMYLFARKVFGSRVMRTNKKVFEYETLQCGFVEERINTNLLFIIFIIVFAIKIIPVLKYSGGLLNTSWGGGRGYSTSLEYANSQQIIRILFYSLSGIIVCFSLQKKRMLIILAIAISLFEVIITRNRIEILPVACSLVTIYLYKNKKISTKVVIVGVIASVTIIYLIYGLRVFRHYGTLDNFIHSFNIIEFNNRIGEYIASDNGELGLRKAFYYFIDHGNNFSGFGRMHTYARMLLIYLPTKWSFGLKPSDFAIAMGAALGNAAGVSTHPTLFGDCYANLGFAGIFLGLFWGFYCNIADVIIQKQKLYFDKILVFVLNAVVYTIIGRGSVYNAFWFAAYGIPLITIVSYLRRHLKIRIVFGKQIKIRSLKPRSISGYDLNCVTREKND